MAKYTFGAAEYSGGGFGSGGSFGSGSSFGKSSGAGVSRAPSVNPKDLDKEEEKVYREAFDKSFNPDLFDNEDEAYLSAAVDAEDVLFSFQNERRSQVENAAIKPEKIIGGWNLAGPQSSMPSLDPSKIEDPGDEKVYRQAFDESFNGNPDNDEDSRYIGAALNGEYALREKYGYANPKSLSMSEYAARQNRAIDEREAYQAQQAEQGPLNQGPQNAAFLAAEQERMEREQRERDDAQTGAGARVQQIVAQKELERKLAEGSIKNEQLRKDAQRDLDNLRSMNEQGITLSQEGLAGVWQTVESVRNEPAYSFGTMEPELAESRFLNTLERAGGVEAIEDDTVRQEIGNVFDALNNPESLRHYTDEDLNYWTGILESEIADNEHYQELKKQYDAGETNLTPEEAMRQERETFDQQRRQEETNNFWQAVLYGGYGLTEAGKYLGDLPARGKDAATLLMNMVAGLEQGTVGIVKTLGEFISGETLYNLSGKQEWLRPAFRMEETGYMQSLRERMNLDESTRSAMTAEMLQRNQDALVPVLEELGVKAEDAKYALQFINEVTSGAFQNIGQMGYDLALGFASSGVGLAGSMKQAVTQMDALKILAGNPAAAAGGTNLLTQTANGIRAFFSNESAIPLIMSAYGRNLEEEAAKKGGAEKLSTADNWYCLLDGILNSMIELGGGDVPSGVQSAFDRDARSGGFWLNKIKSIGGEVLEEEGQGIEQKVISNLRDVMNGNMPEHSLFSFDDADAILSAAGAWDTMITTAAQTTITGAVYDGVGKLSEVMKKVQTGQTLTRQETRMTMDAAEAVMRQNGEAALSAEEAAFEAQNSPEIQNNNFENAVNGVNGRPAPGGTDARAEAAVAAAGAEPSGQAEAAKAELDRAQSEFNQQQQAVLDIERHDFKKEDLDAQLAMLNEKKAALDKAQINYEDAKRAAEKAGNNRQAEQERQEETGPETAPAAPAPTALRQESQMGEQPVTEAEQNLKQAESDLQEKEAEVKKQQEKLDEIQNNEFMMDVIDRGELNAEKAKLEELNNAYQNAQINYENARKAWEAAQAAPAETPVEQTLQEMTPTVTEESIKQQLVQIDALEQAGADPEVIQKMREGVEQQRQELVKQEQQEEPEQPESNFTPQERPEDQKSELVPQDEPAKPEQPVGNFVPQENPEDQKSELVPQENPEDQKSELVPQENPEDQKSELVPQDEPAKPDNQVGTLVEDEAGEAGDGQGNAKEPKTEEPLSTLVEPDEGEPGEGESEESAGETPAAEEGESQAGEGEAGANAETAEDAGTVQEGTGSGTITEEQKNADNINRTYGFNQRTTGTNGRTTYQPGLTVNSWSGDVSDSMRTELQVIHEYAKEHGFAVVMDSTLSKAGIDGTVNGFYKRGENGGTVIHLAQDGTAPLRTTLGHELYHMLSNLNKDGAAQIEKLYREFAARQGVDVDTLVNEKLESYRDMGVELDPDEARAKAKALEEVIADSMYDVIGDERTMRALAMQDRSMAEKIRDWAERVLRDIRKMIDKYGSNKAEAKVLYEQADAMENMRAAVEKALAETDVLREGRKAAKSLGSNSEMLNEYHQAMDAATSREEMNAATLYLAGQVLDKGGVEANWDNMRTLITAALEYASGGGVISQVLNEYGMNTWIPSDEANRAFVTIGRYVHQMLQNQDEQGYLQLMGMEPEEQVQYSIEIDENGNKYVNVDVDQEQFDNLSIVEAQQKAIDILRDRYAGGKVLFETVDAKMRNRGPKHYAYNYGHFEDNERMAKMRASTELQNIAAISTYIGHDPERAKTKNDCIDFEYYKAAIKVGNIPKFDVVINVWIHKNGEREFYDLSKYTKKSTKSTNGLTANGNDSDNGLVTAQDGAPKPIKTQRDEFVNKQIYDNKGKPIPLSERFNDQNEDISWSLSKKIAEAQNGIDQNLPQTVEETEKAGYQVANELGTLERQKSQFSKSDEYKELVNKANNVEDLDTVYQQMKELEDKYNIKQITERINELKEQRTKLGKQEDALRAKELEKEIQDSGKSEDEFFRDRAVKEFGYTPYYYDAGYITPNGKMLNFSGEKGKHFGSRGQDHRSISTIFNGVLEPTESLNEFVNQGNVRIMDESPGIDISLETPLTKEQIATIRQHIRKHMEDGEYYVDFKGPNGMTFFSMEYLDNNVSVQKIINDIEYVQKNKEKPYRSEIANFHTMYSISKDNEDGSIQDVKDSIRYAMDADDAKDMLDLGSDMARTDQGAWGIIDTMRQMKLRQTQDADGNVQQTGGYWKKMAPEVAKSLREYTYGKDQKTIEKAVKELFSDLDAYQGDAKGFVDYAMRRAQETMRDLYTDETENPIKENLKAIFDKYGPLYVTPEQKKELQYYAGGMTEFRRQAAGMVPITNKKSGIGLEEIWSELAPMIGADPDITSVGTMIMEFNDAIGRARTVNGEERTLTDEEIAMLDRRALDLVAEYMQAGAAVVPTRAVEKIDADRHQQALNEVNRLEDLSSQQQDEIDRLTKKLEDAETVNQSLNRQVFDGIKKLDELKKNKANMDELNQAREEYRAAQAEAKESVKAMKDLQKKLDEARAKRDEYRKELTERNRALKQATERSQRYLERLTSAREQQQKQLEKMKQKALEARTKAAARQARTNAINNIRKTGGILRTMFSSPSEKKGYIPMNDVRAAADLVESLVRNDGRTSAAKMSRKLENALRDARESTDYRTKAMYDDGLYQDMQDVTRLLEDKGSLRNLSDSDLEFVNGTLTSIVHQIRTANETIGRQKNQALSDESADMIKVSRENPQGMKGIGRLIRKGILTHLNPQRYFAIMGHHGNNAWTRLGDDLSEAQRKANKLNMDMTKNYEGLTQGENEKKFDKHTGKNATWYDTGIHILNEDGSDSGRTWKMNGGMRAYFALAWGSEQNREGMRAGMKNEKGQELYQLTIPDEELMKKGNQKEAYARGERVYFTEADAKAIIGEVTGYEQSWMNSWRDMEKLSKNAINETSLLLNGFRKATVDNYVPIFRDPRYIGKEFEAVVTDSRLTSMGFLKERVNAHNPMMLMDLTDVIKRQVRDVSTYYGFAVPVRNATRIYNGNMPGYAASVKEVINKTQGMEVGAYFEKLMADLQGGSRVESSPLDKLRGNVAGAVLSGNPSVIIKQAASYPAAASVLGWKPLLKGLKYFNPAGLKGINVDKIDQYTSALWERRSRSLSDLEANANRNTRMSKTMHWLTNGIQGMDVATTKVIWKAAEYYVDEHNPNLSRGTDEYNRAVARIYEQALEGTQPEYGTMQRPGILRSQSQIVKSLTMYKTQSLQNFNILVDAATNLSDKAKAAKANNSEENQAALKAAKRQMATALSSQITSAVILGVMTAVGKALLHKLGGYRDDKGDLTTESVGGQILKDSASSVAGMVAGGSELFDLVNGLIEGQSPFDIEAAGVSTINDLYQNTYAFLDAMKVIGDGDLTDAQKLSQMWPKVRKLGLSVTQLLGLPVGNFANLIDGIAANAADFATGKPGSFASGSPLQIAGTPIIGSAQGRETSNKSVAGYIAQAMMDGDEAEAMRLYNEQIRQGKSVDALNSAIASWQKANIPEIRQAAEAIDAGDLSLYNQLINELTGKGLSMTNAVKYVEAERKKMTAEPKKEEEASGALTYQQILSGMTKETKTSEENSYTNGMMNSLLEDGNVQAAMAVRDDMLANGKTKSSISSSLSSFWKPRLQEAYAAGDMVTVRQITQMLVQMGLSHTTIQGWTSSTGTSSSSSSSKSSFGSGSFGGGSFGNSKKSSSKKSSFGSGSFGKGSFGK